MHKGDSGYSRSRKAAFLKTMDRTIPWSRLAVTIRQLLAQQTRVKPIAGNTESLLRIYFLQYWFGLSDRNVEDALYDSLSMQAFCRMDSTTMAVPAAQTIRKFRYLLESHHMGGELLSKVNHHLQQKGIEVIRGSMMDATITQKPVELPSAEPLSMDSADDSLLNAAIYPWNH